MHLHSMSCNRLEVKSLLIFSGGRTEKRFIGFGPFFVGLSVNGSKFVGLSVKGKHCGVGD